MSEWQPIETAPKDGTKVFLWTDSIEAAPNDGMTKPKRIESRWSRGVWQNEYDNGPAYHVVARRDEYGFLSATWIMINPTHWMPVPAPPK